MVRKWLKWVLLGGASLFLALQLVPYGRDHTNPAMAGQPEWSTPAVRALASRACFDCHSNETRWTWYTNVAPISWLVQYDVVKGREALNFSEWNRPHQEAKDAAKEMLDGEMPPALYTLLHREAVLSTAERRALIEGLELSLGTRPAASLH